MKQPARYRQQHNNQPPDASPIWKAIELIEERTGLAAGTQFRADLDATLHQLAYGDVEAFVRRLAASRETSVEWQAVLSAITVGETYFMRDRIHFEILKTQILPEMVMRHRQEDRLNLNVWSVGCASGEEPYSIAVTLQEFLPDLARWRFNLIGSDINARALQQAQNGYYRQWSFRHTDTVFKQRYFDAAQNSWKIHKNIQDMVTFRHANLLDGPPMPRFDIIFCRNVLIYFSKRSVTTAEKLLYDALVPGGWLILGQSEAIRSDRDRWVTHIFPGSALYQKPGSHLDFKAGHVHYHSREKTRTDIFAAVEVPEEPDERGGKVALYADAVQAVHNEQYEEAERHLSQVIERQPKNAKAHTLLAFIFANRQAIPEAKAQLDKALQIDPLLADAHYVRAMLAIEKADVEATKQALHAALYCDRGHALAAFTLGNFYAQDGNLSKARKTWKNAERAIASLQPDDYISDLSDMTARYFKALLNNHLRG